MPVRKYKKSLVLTVNDFVLRQYPVQSYLDMNFLAAAMPIL